MLGITGCIAAASAPSAFADSSPYELFCPGTPVGNIALNGVVTTATITPASPATGSSFQVTNYQTSVAIPSSIAGAAAALGNTAISGSAKTTIDATGATPASIQSPTLSFNQPIPSPVPASGLQLTLPSPAGSLGPFTASGGAISITQDKAASLTLVVSGNNLTLTCTAYPNNTVAQSGITSSTPSGAPLSPVIATGTAGGAAPAASATPTTTAAPATAPSGSLAYTGAGPGIYLLGIIGAATLAGAGMLLLGVRARLALAAVIRGRRRHDGG